MTKRPPSFPPSSPETSAVAVAEPAAPKVQPGVRVTDALSDRLAERRRARRRLRLRALVIVVACALLIAGAGYVALASSVLALRADEVRVQGANEIAPADQVLEVVAPLAGVPLLRLDTAALRQELLGIVGVRDVSIARDFPNGLTVTVQPRVPVATVREEGQYVLLDGDGVELARGDQPADGVPQVRVPVGSEETAAALTAVLDVMAALPADILDQVLDASATSAHEIEFTLTSGATVVWGSAIDNALKARVLDTLLQLEANVYDVSAPLSPTTR